MPADSCGRATTGSDRGAFQAQSDAKSRLAPGADAGGATGFWPLPCSGMFWMPSLGLGKATILSRPGLNIVDVGWDVEIQESDLELNDALNAFIEERGRPRMAVGYSDRHGRSGSFDAKDVVGILNCRGRCGSLSGAGWRHQYDPHSQPEVSHLLPGAELSQASGLMPRKAGLKAAIFESFRAGCDIDEPEDLAEVLLHGRGRQNRFWNLWVLFYQIKAENALIVAPNSDIDILCPNGVNILRMSERAQEIDNSRSLFFQTLRHEATSLLRIAEGSGTKLQTDKDKNEL